jgi:hypothetical protein
MTLKSEAFKKMIPADSLLHMGDRERRERRDGKE